MISGTYGDLTIEADGDWSYSADNSQSAIQALGQGDTLTDTITVTSDDGTTQDITITITGTNDDPTIGGDTSGSVTEDAAATLTTSGTLTISDTDTGEAVFNAETISGTYGDLTIEADGDWSYSADNSQSAIQALGQGDTLTDTITVTSDDGTTQDITITITGTNDDPTIGGDTSGSVTEDAAATLTTSGTLTISDTDTGEAVFNAETISGTYGSLTIEADGDWSYSADNSQSAIQALGDGDTLTDTITVTSDDGTTQDITITITGTNDDPTIGGDTSGSVTEDAAATLTTSGTLTISDTDTGEAVFNAETISGTYGDLTIEADGDWSYSADNSQSAIQALGQGDTLTDTITVTSDDGTTQDITITITGTNDDPTIGGDTTGGVTEDAAATLTTSGTLTISDTDTGEAVFNAETISGTYGDLTIEADGDWSYSADNSQSAIQALGQGDTLTDTITVTSDDGTTQDITITITGTNDDPTIGGDTTGGVTEDAAATLTTSGTLTISDTDTGEAVFNAETISGTYGDLTIEADGDWSYSADNSQSAIQALGQGDTLTDTITVTSDDGTTQDITITITGTNDDPTIGGDTSGSVTEDAAATLTTSGTLTISDTDTGEAVFNAETISGTYGSLTIEADGDWSYSADNSQSAIQALGDGDTLTDTITVTSDDGTTQDITITITGTNDDPTIGGDTSGSVTEDAAATLTTSGTLTISDTDTGEAVFNAETISGTYGDLTIEADGDWSYSADNSQSAIQALGQGDTLTDTITVTSDDGTTQDITITITGTNDAPTAVTDNLSTDENQILTIETSELTNNDYDIDGDSFSVTDIDSSGMIGDLSVLYNMGEVGQIDLSSSTTINFSSSFTNPVVFAFVNTENDSDPVIARVDNVTQGSFDLSLVEPDNLDNSHGTETVSYIVLEAGIWALPDGSTIEIGTFNTSNVIGSASNFDEVAFDHDFDNTPIVFSQIQTSNNNFDFLKTRQKSPNSDEIDIGIERYEDDSSDLANNETIAYFAIEESSGSWSGHNFIVGNTSNSVRHNDYTQNFGTDLGSGDISMIGQLATFDGGDDASLRGVSTNSTSTQFNVEEDTTNDSETNHTTEIANFFAIAGSGLLTAELVSSPSTIPDSQISSIEYDPGSNFDYLGEGETATDTFTYTITDEHGASSTETVTITINGTNDAPIIGGIDTGTVTEDNDSTLMTSGSLTISDIDTGEAIFNAETISGSYGDLIISANGDWSYSADNSQTAIQALAQGANLTDSITVTSADGTTHDITITITGTDDAPVIGGDTSGAITEDTATTLTTSGTLTISDIDEGEDATFAVETLSGIYGSLDIAANGDWSYSADNAQSAIQALGQGDTLTDTITVTSADGNSTQDITITITGTNDDPIISGDTTGTVTEDAAATLTTSGILTISDTDTGEAAFNAETISGTYGDLTIESDGDWSYSADNSQAVIQALGNGDILTDTITVTSADGSTQDITITITGTNDAPTAVADNLSTDENQTLVIETSDLTSNDYDIDGDSFSVTDIDSSGMVGDLSVLYNMGEVGQVDLSSSTTINFSSSFTNPVVFAFVNTENGPDPVIARVDNVTQGSFDLSLVEPDNLDNIHTTETVSYVILEAGVWALPDGSTIEIGTFETSNVTSGSSDFDEVNFSHNFDSPPIVFSQIQTTNNNFDFLKTRQKSPTSDEVDIVIERYESNSSNLSIDETVAYFAIEESSGSWSGHNFVIGKTPDAVTDDDYTQSFGTDLGTGDITMIGQLATFDGRNDAALRGSSTNSTSTQFSAEEDTTEDSETYHPSEVANFFAIAGGGLLTAELISSPSTISDSQISSIEYDPGSNFDYLSEGETATDTFTYTIIDEHGASSTETVTITINGTNDAPIIGGMTTGSVIEDGGTTLTTSGSLTISDVDTGEAVFNAETVTGSYGNITIATNGDWSYSADNSQTIIQALGDGDTLTDTITITSADGTTQTITITITGTDDAPVISGDITGLITEDAASTLTASGSLTISDIDTGENTTFVAETITGNYGNLSIDENGDWSYSADNSQAAIQALGQGDTLTDTITVISNDGTTQDITITITGTNDDPTISGNTTGSVTEDAAATLTTSGTLTISDTDTGEAIFNAEIISGTYGSLSIEADGDWSYSADNSQTAIQALGDGDTLTDTITVTSADGTTQTITITITGTDDAPVISGDITGLITEDAASTLTASGSLTISDIDTGENTTFVAETITGSYGNLSIDENGDWSYSADNSQAAIQALGQDDTLTDTITVTSNDGITQDITITITGTNDDPTISGNTTGTVTEDAAATLTISGTLTISDTDTDEAIFNAETVTGSYGNITIATNGDWSYSADNSQTIIQALGDGDTLTDTITITSADGTTQTITITITGTDDAPVISGDITGLITEDAASTLTASGSLTISDIDTGESTTFVAETIIGSYGNLSIDENGDWSYSADNSQAAIQALGQDDTLTDTITVISNDGTTQDITITITGTNDDPTISGNTTGSVTEDAAATLTTSGTLTISDTDTGEATFNAETISGTYGSLSIEADGDWSYSADNSQTAIQALGDGNTLTDTITVTSDDGTTQDIIITITGTNDAPVAVVDTATTSENTSLPIEVLANDTDIDTGDILSIESASIIGSNNGSVTIIDNELVFNPGFDFDDLAVNESRNITINYTIEDNNGAQSTASVTVTVTGTNDTPTAVIDTTTTTADSSITIDVLANDTDPDTNDTLTIISATIDDLGGSDGDDDDDDDDDDSGNNASVSTTNDGLVFDPGDDFNHLAYGETQDVTISYIIEDNHGAQSTSTVTVTVTGVNYDPVAINDTYASTGYSTVIDVLANDYDPNGSTLTITSATVTGDLEGTIEIINNQIVYIPDFDDQTSNYYNMIYYAFPENANTTINYTIENDQGYQDTANVDISLTDLGYYLIITDNYSNSSFSLSNEGDYVRMDGNDDFTLYGNAGNDVLIGDRGDYTFYGGAGDDYLEGGREKDELYGGDGDDILIGGKDKDTLDGGAGDDYLDGGDKDDIILGGSGDDYIIGGSGKDTIDGGSGIDTLSYEDASSKITVDLSDGSGSQGDAKDDAISNIENVTGSDFDDTITGDDNDNIIIGGAGDDTIYGLGGDDTIYGLGGEDTYIYQAGDDDDSFHGGTGNWIDTIELQGIDSAPNSGDWTLTVTNNANFTVDSETNTVVFDSSASGSIVLNSGEELDFDEIEKIVWTS
ncbi:VCBS domain-containing protein [Thiotrichales bacterium 19X7-9]|nr:VCBS domain-containing protein [Thiotrichales bacterium 19X7-9]